MYLGEFLSQNQHLIVEDDIVDLVKFQDSVGNMSEIREFEHIDELSFGDLSEGGYVPWRLTGERFEGDIRIGGIQLTPTLKYNESDIGFKGIVVRIKYQTYPIYSECADSADRKKVWFYNKK